MPLTPRRRNRRPFLLAAGVACAAALTDLSAKPQESKSAPLAKELVIVLDTAKLDSIAAADPATPGEFVAAIYIPGTQLLVVSAKYSVPTLLVDKLNSGDFRGVYMDLHAAGVPGSRVFVQDVEADGLISRSSGAADSWDEGDKSVTFDGAWRKAKMTEEGYTKVFAEADARYTKMLAALLAQAKQLKGKAGS
jgi:hypothetical protein